MYAFYMHQLVNLFRADEDPIRDFSQARTKCCAEAAMLLALGHGVADEQRAKNAYKFPKGSDGREVVLAPFAPRAAELANSLSALVEQRASATACAASAKRSS